MIEEIRCAADSPLEEAVSSEPVSGREFPVKQGKYREFSRCSPDLLEIYVKKSRRFSDLGLDFPAQSNREFFAGTANRNQGNREISGPRQKEKGRGRTSRTRQQLRVPFSLRLRRR